MVNVDEIKEWKLDDESRSRDYLRSLDYDYARLFIRTGKRTEIAKARYGQWFMKDHVNYTYVGKYCVEVFYHSVPFNMGQETIVSIYIPNGNIPYKVANDIYERFEKYVKHERPDFEYYDGIESSHLTKSKNPTLVNSASCYREFESIIDSVCSQILQGKKESYIQYLFPEELVKKIKDIESKCKELMKKTDEENPGNEYSSHTFLNCSSGMPMKGVQYDYKYSYIKEYANEKLHEAFNTISEDFVYKMKKYGQRENLEVGVDTITLYSMEQIEYVMNLLKKEISTAA